MPLDPRLRMILDLLESQPRDDSGTPAERRARIVAQRAASGVRLGDDGPAMLSETAYSANGVPVVAFRPSAGTLPCIVEIHGGGWWQGSVSESAPAARRRAAAVGAVVVSVDYRLAPEHPFPTGLEDCFAAASWVFSSAAELDIDPARVAIQGESAGGNLAAAVCLLARDRGGPSFAAQVLHYPGMDLTMTDSPSMVEYGERHMFTRAALDECREFYCGAASPSDPLISPVFAELHDLPPALVMTAECDPVRDSGNVYAARLAEAGVTVTHKEWPSICHGAGEVSLVIPEIAEKYTAMVTEFYEKLWAS